MDTSPHSRESMQPLIIPCAPALMPGILPRGAAPCSAQPLIGRHEPQVDDTISDAGGEIGAAAGPANPPRPRRALAPTTPNRLVLLISSCRTHQPFQEKIFLLFNLMALAFSFH